MRNERRIIMSRDDHRRLSEMSENAHLAGEGRSSYLRRLNQNINAATVLDPTEVPADVLRVGSRIRLLDLNLNEELELQLVFPEDADAMQGRFSILAPSGTALIGTRVGDTVEFEAPGGTQRLKVLGVE